MRVKEQKKELLKLSSKVALQNWYNSYLERRMKIYEKEMEN